MNSQNQFPNTIEVYFDKHPEAIECRRQPLHLVKNAGLIVAAIAACFILSSWLVYVIAAIVVCYAALQLYLGEDNYFSVSSGGEIRKIVHKKFEGSRDAQVRSAMVKAFEERNFDSLAEDVSQADDEPLQLFVYEDKKGKVFYAQLKCYTSKSDFDPITDVIVLSGDEYSKNEQAVRSMV